MSAEEANPIPEKFVSQGKIVLPPLHEMIPGLSDSDVLQLQVYENLFFCGFNLKLDTRNPE